MSAGRPSKYTREIADMICELTATTHKSMKTICSEVGIPYGTHLEWVRSNEEYSRLYARAKDAQADLLVEEIIEIADDSSNDIKHTENGETINSEFVQRSRLRIDARKWVAAKLKPKKYGDKIEHSGSIELGSIDVTKWIDQQKDND